MRKAYGKTPDGLLKRIINSRSSFVLQRTPFLYSQNNQSRQECCEEQTAQDVERIMNPHINATIAAQQCYPKDENRQQPTSSDFFPKEEEKEERCGHVVYGVVRRATVFASFIISSIFFLKQMNLIFPMIFGIVRGAQTAKRGFQHTCAYSVR